MRATATPTLFTLESQPAWGRAALLEEKDGKLVLFFEHGGRRVFVKTQVKGLQSVQLSDEEARTVEARLRGKHPLGGATKKSSKAKAKATRPLLAAFPSFDAQVRWFETFFPGGFAGEKFVAEERGTAEAKGKKGYKTGAIKLAQEQLSPERLASATPEETFLVSKKLLAFTNLVFPIEGSIPFTSMKEEDRAGFAAALGELLHGEGAHGPRFEKFANAIRIWDAAGQSRKVTWPLATLLQALYAPAQHTFVKPTVFEQQALLLNLTADRHAPVTSTHYERFLDVARKTSERLVAVGHQPRDLMDVYSFIWRSHKEQPPA
ncbi:hypothetical protein [Hyalangium minutum]|uniref:Uncharacterized protein n=1 Tax=Hyalangium minutum TaxID=394096 RepID=A0A085W9H1_9BACT|nr:hypothetical protein [Hyalangium minutum]KFE64334.1 hypothetical protein DB31_2128 [Hyalangium minutum]